MMRDEEQGLSNEQCEQVAESQEPEKDTIEDILTEDIGSVKTKSSHDRLEATAEEIQEKFGDQGNKITTRVMMIGININSNWSKIMGLQIRLMASERVDVVTGLDEVEDTLYSDGYNITWVVENLDSSENDPIPEETSVYKGTINAVLAEDGVPIEPGADEPQNKATEGKKTH